MPPPDADLRPVATGLAEETVDRHCSKEPLILYAGWFLSVHLLNPPRPPRLINRATRSGTTFIFPPPAGLANINLSATRVNCTGRERHPVSIHLYVEVNPYYKPESLIKLNLRDLVPTLQNPEQVALEKYLYLRI